MSVQSLKRLNSAAILLSLSYRTRVKLRFCKIKLPIPWFFAKFGQLHKNRTPFWNSRNGWSTAAWNEARTEIGTQTLGSSALTRSAVFWEELHYQTGTVWLVHNQSIKYNHGILHCCLETPVQSYTKKAQICYPFHFNFLHIATSGET